MDKLFVSALSLVAFSVADASAQVIGGGAPALHAKAKIFSVSPKPEDQDFLCEQGFVNSVTATAADKSIIPATLIDANKQPIPADAWTSASGFRITKTVDSKVSVILICGN